MYGGGVYGPPSILSPGKLACSACAHARNWPFTCHDAQNSMRSVESCLSIAGVLYSVTILYIERSTFSLAGFSDHF